MHTLIHARWLVYANEPEALTSVYGSNGRDKALQFRTKSSSIVEYIVRAWLCQGLIARVRVHTITQTYAHTHYVPPLYVCEFAAKNWHSCGTCVPLAVGSVSEHRAHVWVVCDTNGTEAQQIHKPNTHTLTPTQWRIATAVDYWTKHNTKHTHMPTWDDKGRGQEPDAASTKR